MPDARFSLKVQFRALGIGNQHAATLQQPHNGYGSGDTLSSKDSIKVTFSIKSE